MIHLTEKKQFYMDTPSAITLGKFDGLHRGHMLLIERLISECKRRDLVSTAFTFDIPPKSLVDDISLKQLLTREEKAAAFSASGLEYLIECPFTEEVRSMLPEEFIRWMTGALKARCFVIGEDFRFGKNREGDASFLQAYEKKYDYQTIVLPKIRENGREISSTYVRERISEGNIEQANHLLGYSYYVTGKVCEGEHLGRRLGIPTANLLPSADKLLPPAGVYLTRLQTGNMTYTGVTNVGHKPTIAGDHPTGVETHLLNFSGDMYGKQIKVEFLKRLREERRFENIEQLQLQMERDIYRAKTIADREYA